MGCGLFRPPAYSLGDLEGFADWVELCALRSADGYFSRSQMADVLRDEGLIGGSPEDVFSGDVLFGDAASFSDEDAGDRFSEEVWQVLLDRQHLLGVNYPFTVEEGRLVRRGESWTDFLSYAALLLADAWKIYELGSVAEEPFVRLFEKLVQASEVGLLRGTAVRFGVPRDDGWPTDIKDRIGYLGALMSLEVENLEGKTTPHDGDRGLDVVGRLSFGDDGSGSIILLTQCAAGIHWRKKLGEPSLQNWQDILRWNAKIVRAVAIPWRLNERERIQEFRRFDAVILDRFRLVVGMPDRSLPADVRGGLLAWCGDRFRDLPTLS
jgi:hypothetical protein